MHTTVESWLTRANSGRDPIRCKVYIIALRSAIANNKREQSRSVYSLTRIAKEGIDALTDEHAGYAAAELE